MKRIIGIIVEYNPLHNGHIQHINKIKTEYPDSIIIAAMSGNVVQRGEYACISKFDRAIEAINNNVDIVIEIPSFYVLNNANIYASKAIEILNDFFVEKIIFGSESNDIGNLSDTADRINNIEDETYKEEWKKNYSMPKTLEKLARIDFKSNDILGLSYLIEGKKINPKIQFETIKRINNENFKTAFQIRNAMKQNIDISELIPNRWLYQENIVPINNDEFEIFYKYDLFTKDNLNKQMNFLKNKISNEEKELSSISSKNFTKSNLKRETIKFSLNIKETTYNQWRVLAYSKEGKNYLSEKRSEINYSTKYNVSYENELKIARVLSILYGSEVISNEINFNPEFAEKKRLKRIKASKN